MEELEILPIVDVVEGISDAMRSLQRRGSGKRSISPAGSPACARALVALAGLCLLLGSSGCGLRTLPPVRYIPLVGTEKKVTTTLVLVRALKDRDVAVRAEAVELLGVLGQSPDEKTRKAVARVLGRALQDRDPGLRLQAVEKLGEMDAAIANKYLISALRDPNTFVRTKVLSVVGERERMALQALQAQQQSAGQPLTAQVP